MKTKDEINKLKLFIEENCLALVYISSNKCGVCHALLPKIQLMLERYPKIKFKKINIDECTEIAGQFSIFTIPAILFFINGKEVIRKARFISMDELEENISRYYTLFI